MHHHVSPAQVNRKKTHVLQHSPPEGDLTSLLENSLEVVSIALCFSTKINRILKILKGGMVIPLIIPNVP